MNLMVFVITGFVLFFLFRLLFRITKALTYKPAIKKGSMALLPLLELVLWVGYAFWGVYIFFGDHLYYDLIIGVMVVLLLVVIAWFVFRDFLAGVLLKAEKALEPGQMIRTPVVEGRIKRLGSRSLELVNQAGEVVRLPYARLSSEVFILPPESEESLPHRVEVPLPGDHSPEEIQKEILKSLHAMPWIIAPAPEVKIIKGTGGRHLVQTTFYTHIGSQAAIVEERIRRVVKDHGSR